MNLILNGEYEGSHSQHNEGKIIMGSAVNQLPKELQIQYAYLVNQQLETQTFTKPRTVLQLEEDMRAARAIICHNPNTNELLAFGKVEYYGVSGIPRQIFYEFGAWTCLRKGNGYGVKVLEAARDLAAEQFPFARLIAVVRPSNLKAQNIITQHGGTKVGYIEPEMKHIYDITRRQQPLEVIKMGPGGIWTHERNYQHVI